jgi:hypothetical protein
MIIKTLDPARIEARKKDHFVRNETFRGGKYAAYTPDMAPRRIVTTAVLTDAT